MEVSGRWETVHGGCRIEKWGGFVGDTFLVISLGGYTSTDLDDPDTMRVGQVVRIETRRLAASPELFARTLDRMVRDLDRHVDRIV